jgi:hypothetical protein
LRERWMLFLVLTKSYLNLVGHVRIRGPLWSHAVVVLGCCYPNVNVTARRCYNGASGELFNDPLFINILSKLIQNLRSWQY